MGDEIWRQTNESVDAFVHSVGTGCSLRGTAEALKKKRSTIRVVAVEPAESPVLSGGEQDHRNIKSRVTVMLGLKRFKNAAITIAGIELMHRIRKGKFNLAARFKEAAVPAVWNAVLSA